MAKRSAKSAGVRDNNLLHIRTALKLHIRTADKLHIRTADKFQLGADRQTVCMQAVPL